MSIEYIDRVWADESLDQSEKIVMLSLADRANEKGICWPAIQDTARRAHLTVRAAQRVLRRLEIAKKLRTLLRKGPNGTNIYHILLSEPPDRKSPQTPDPKSSEVTLKPDEVTLKPSGGDPKSPKPSGTVKNQDSEREGCAEDHEVEPPKKWPRTEKEAREWSAFSGCTPELAAHVWHKAASRGWCDSKGIPIRNSFASFCKVEATYEANRIAENAKKNGGVNGAHGKRQHSVLDLKTILEAKKEKANAIKQRHAAECPMGLEWGDKKKRDEYFVLKREIKALNDQLGRMA